MHFDKQKQQMMTGPHYGMLQQRLDAIAHAATRYYILSSAAGMLHLYFILAQLQTPKIVK